ncbi:MAG: hypothetical protein RBS37_00725 [Bacteroidales bacterium]|nr:hypothetical protein [Bacteroidales bacterium]
MKRLILLLVSVVASAAVLAQVPVKMSYQAVIRDVSNVLVSNQTIGIKVSILREPLSEIILYSETQTPTTNANGLMSIEFGGMELFSSIDWWNPPFYLRTEIDPAGGTNYTISGTSQLLSVPYSFVSAISDISRSVILPGSEKQLIFNDADNLGSDPELVYDKTSNHMAIGSSTVNPNAVLDLKSTSGALLLPRMTSMQRDALTTEEGMIIYNIETRKFQGCIGIPASSAYGNIDVNTSYGNGLGENAGHHVFNPPEGGIIDSIQLWISANQTAISTTISVYNDRNTGCGGNPVNLGTSGTLTVKPGEWNTFIFETPVRVNTGIKYHIWSAAVLSIDGADNNPENTVTDWYEGSVMDLCSYNTYDRPVRIFLRAGGWVDLNLTD